MNKGLRRGSPRDGYIITLARENSDLMNKGLRPVYRILLMGRSRPPGENSDLMNKGLRHKGFLDQLSFSSSPPPERILT